MLFLVVRKGFISIEVFGVFRIIGVVRLSKGFVWIFW